MIKLLKREIIVLNLIFFCFVSIFLLHISESISKGVSSFAIENMVQFLSSNIIIFLLMLCTGYLIYKGKKISMHFLVIYSNVLIVRIIIQFINSSDKAILLISIMFAFLAYFFCQIWFVELKDPIYTPSFPFGQISNYASGEITIKATDAFGSIGVGFISNLGPNSCFVVFKKKELVRGVVNLEVFWLGKNFHCVGKVLTECENGYGIRLFDNTNDKNFLKWSDVYTIAADRGLVLSS